jgi:hypothetical protein
MVRCVKPQGKTLAAAEANAPVGIRATRPASSRSRAPPGNALAGGSASLRRNLLQEVDLRAIRGKPSSNPSERGVAQEEVHENPARMPHSLLWGASRSAAPGDENQPAGSRRRSCPSAT